MKSKINNLINLSILLLVICYGCVEEEQPAPTKSDAKSILSIAFKVEDNPVLSQDVLGNINEISKTISAEVPFGTDITNLLPQFEISAGADIEPNVAQDFSSPVSYRVTAEDGSEQVYTATVQVAKSSQKQILDFQFLKSDNPIDVNIIASINETSKSITFTTPYLTDLTALVPVIQVSEGATVDPFGARDFSQPLQYTVTAEDGSVVVYTTTNLLTQLGILARIFEVNPDNTLNWDINDPDINNWPGMEVDEDGMITKLSIFFGNIHVLPPEIGLLEQLTSLIIDQSVDQIKISALPPEIGNLKNLIHLNLHRSELSNLPPEIGQLVNLTKLSLPDNKIKSIPSEIAKLQELEFLDLTDNALTSIPDEIGKLEKLERLLLSSNEIDDIPLIFNNLSSLEVLSLHLNQISDIPPEILQWKNIKGFTIFGNQLTSIPPEFGEMITLEILDFHDNQLKEIPAELGKLKNLNTLNLLNNKLTSIPEAVCNLVKNNTEVMLDPEVKCE